MQGLRIHSQKPFAEALAGVIPMLAGKSWLALPQSFNYSVNFTGEEDNELESSVDERLAAFEAIVQLVEQRSSLFTTILGYVVGPALFPDHAHMVSGDWASLFSLRDRVEDAQAWFEKYYAQERRDAYLSANCDVVLHSVDSAFYEIFAEPALLNACRWHLDALGIRYQAVRLADCSYL